jgi:hypothetical protein
MVTALTTVGALLIGLNGSTVEKVLHYPRPEHSNIEQTFTTANPQPQDLLDVPRIKKEELPARNGPEKNINSRALFAEAYAAKPTLEIKSKLQRLPHLNKLKGLAPEREKAKTLAPKREKYEGHDYAMTIGHAEGSGYRPGLDAQR